MPISVGDSYTRNGGPFTFAGQVQGAWVTVATLNDLNAIPAANTFTGQVVLVEENDALYKATTTTDPSTFEPVVTWGTYRFRGENDVFVYDAFNVVSSSSEATFPDVEFFYIEAGNSAVDYAINPTADRYFKDIPAPSNFPISIETMPKVYELSWDDINVSMRFLISNQLSSVVSQSQNTTPFMMTFWIYRQEYFDNLTEGIGTDVGPWFTFTNTSASPNTKNIFLYANGINSVEGDVNYGTYSTANDMRSTIMRSIDGWDMIKIEIDAINRLGTYAEINRDFANGTDFTGTRKVQFGNVQMFTEIFDILPETLYYKLKRPYNPNAAAGDSEAILNRLTALEEAGGNQRGSKIANYLHKLRQWRIQQRLDPADRNPMVKEPFMVFLGDSITTGSWSTDFANYLKDEYLLSDDAIQIIAYGGYPIDRFLPNIDSLVASKPDLIIFNEFDPLLNNVSGRPYNFGDRLYWIESYIKILRERTSADLVMGTWSVAENDLNAYANNDYRYDGMVLSQMSFYEQIDLYRGVAAKYQCELIDFSKATFDYAKENGIEAFSEVTNFPHLNADLYASIFIPELKKYFGTYDVTEYANGTYPNTDKQELMQFQDSYRYQRLSLNGATITGTVNKYGPAISSSDSTFAVSYDAKDIIGFDIIHLYESTGTGVMSITVDAAAPSTITTHGVGSVLQYATEVVAVNASDTYSWRTKRPLMQAYVEGNILTDSEEISGQYKIDVIGVGEVVSYTSGSSSVLTLTGDYVNGINNQVIKVNYVFTATTLGSTSFNGTNTIVSGAQVHGDLTSELATGTIINISNDTGAATTYAIEATITAVSYNGTLTTFSFEVVGDYTANFDDPYRVTGYYANVTASAALNGSNTDVTVSQTISTAFSNVNNTAEVFIVDKDNKQKVLCEVFDTTPTSVGTFVVGHLVNDEFVIQSQGSGGEIVFESTWNGEPNYYLAAGELDSFGEPALSKFFIGDRYVFYIKNNWVDNVYNNVDRDYKVFGLNRGDYTINISRTSGDCKLLGLVLHR